MSESRPSVFVIMPFSDAFSDTYELGIKGACDQVGIECSRADEQIFLRSILDQIYDQIEKSDIVISEMTGRNPNVFYETGYAHGLEKPVILLTKQTDDIPFDLRQYPHVVHGGSITTLKRELVKRLQFFVKNPSELKQSSRGRKKLEPDWIKIAKHIENYLSDKDFAMVSFERIRKNINSEYSDELLLQLVDHLPKKFRRARLKGNKLGLKWLVKSSI
jgi:hypothetical protein